MKQLSIGAGFCLSFVSGWLSEASWDKLDDKVQGVYKMSTWQTLLLQAFTSTGWQQQNMCKLVEQRHYFTFLDSQASWVKTAIRFAQPSWLRGTTSAEDFAHSSKLDGWSTKPKQNLRTREQNRRSGSYLITLCASNLRLHLKTDKIHQNSAIATDH